MFKYTRPNDSSTGSLGSLQYEYSVQDNSDEHTYCISTISCCKINSNERDLVLVSGSNKSLKVWRIEITFNNTKTFKKNDAKQLKMCKQFSFHNLDFSGASESEDEEDDDKQTNNELKEDEEVPKTKKGCIIQ